MYDMTEKAKNEVREIVLNALGRAISAGSLSAEPIPDFTVEIPNDTAHGDFSCNAALVSAKAFRSNPRAIAQAISENVILDGTFFDKIEVAGPGFLNFFINSRWFSETVETVKKLGSDYGKVETGKGKSILVEFVSANPTGPMHIGNARGGAIGDCLASILEYAGYTVEREFYINDAGNQVNKFGKSLDLRYMQLFTEEGQKIIAECGSDLEKLCREIYDNTVVENEEGTADKNAPFYMPNDVYLGMDIIAHAKNYYDRADGKAAHEMSEEDRRAKLVAYALPLNIQGLKDDLAKYRIHYNTWFRESSLHESGKVSEIVEILKKNGHTYEKDGAVWFKASEFGDDQDRVLVRANGVPTYFVPDIAYHYNKLVTRGFDTAIDVLGADHHGYVPRMKAALTALGVDSSRLDVVIMQMVRLVRNGETVKLSKRSGKAITLATLLDEIPMDAARFFFNLRDPNTHLEFDLDLAIEESSKNPVFYVQYAHARICRVIERIAAEGIILGDFSASEISYTEPAELAVIRKLASLPEEITEAAKTYNPSIITRYVYDLAQLFHKFYDSCKLLGEEKAVLRSRLALCTAVKTVLKNMLDLLKVEAPDKM